MTTYEHALVMFSENPSLGPGRISIDRRARTASIRMLLTGAILPFRREALLSQYPLSPGSIVTYTADPTGPSVRAEVIRELTNRQGQLRLFALSVEREEIEADESQVEPLAPDPADVVARLRALRWDRPTDFYARRALLRQVKNSYEEGEGVPTLTGARIKSMAHQVYAVQRVLWARVPRFVLADEVGLGKTIEAGLVIQALMAADPALSVLVVAPGSMTRQWLCELYLRFGGRAFQVVSDLEQRVGDQVIVSTTTLSRQPESWSKVTARRWGMVVLDEAHQHPPGTPLYELYRQLSECCDGILVLSATPSKREIRGILGLLSLVAPEQYGPGDEARLAELWDLRRDIWDRLGYHQRLRDAPDFATMGNEELTLIAEDWEPLLEGDASAASLLERLRQADRTAFDELEAYVQEHYRVDHRIVRTRRSTVQSLGQPWCKRVLEVVEYEPTAAETLFVQHVEAQLPELSSLDPARRALAAVFARLLRLGPDRCVAALVTRQTSLRRGEARSTASRFWDELLSDPSPEEEERLRDDIIRQVATSPDESRWLDHGIELAKSWAREGPLAARHQCAIEWIEAHLEAHPDQKLLVFTEDRVTARAFAEALGQRIRRTVEAFHWVENQADEEELKRITSEFQRNPQRPVLVSDELGGEGRNFQMAEAVLHLDCPWEVARLEQRIGRLDRIGRDASRPVRSVVFLGEGELEREIHRVHAEVFGVHSRSIGGLEFLLPVLQRRILEGAVAGAAAMRSRHDELATEVENALRDAAHDLDQALDTSKYELDRARELAEVLATVDGTTWLEPVQFWARALAFKAEAKQSADGVQDYQFRWTPDLLNHQLPGYQGDAARRDVGTFDRERALQREDLQFFAPGHRLVDAQVRALRSAPIGRLTVLGRSLGQACKRRIFALVMVHFDIDPSLWSDDPLEAGLLTRARRRLYPEIIERSVSLTLEPEVSAELVRDRALRGALEADYEGRESAVLVPPEAIAGSNVAALCRGLEAALEVALDAATAERLEYAEEARAALAADFALEMGFLSGRANRHGDDAARRAMDQRQLLLDNLNRSRAEVGGVALILGI